MPTSWMRSFVLLLVTVLVGLLGTCVPITPPAPDPDPDPDPEQVDLTEVEVTTTPETARASSATLGAAGGLIEATGVDGTRYRLLVPPGALSDEVEITMTPAAAGGLDEVADEVTAGVELSPSGLQFALSAFLEVRLAPGRTLPEGVIFSSTHRSDTPGIELPPATVSEDATSVTVQIDHFSGATVWTGKVDALVVLWQQALTVIPTLESQVPGFVAAAKKAFDAVGAADETEQLADYRSEAVAVYRDVLLPLLDAAGDSIDDAAVAHKSVVAFAAILQQVEAAGATETVLDPPVETAANVEMLAPLAKGRLIEAVGRLRDTYLPPLCSAEVVALADWVNLPSFLGLLQDFTISQNDWIPTSLCVRPVATGPVYDPTVLSQDDRFVEVTADVVTAVPDQTPLPAGSDTRPLGSGRIGVVSPAQLEASATGGAFRQGETTVGSLTASLPDGEFVGSIDRGVDPELRALSLSVSGTFRLDGPDDVLKVAAEVIDGWNLAPLSGSASSDELGLQVARWDGLPDAPQVPVDERILDPGGTTNVCVEVRDRLGATVSGISVGFSTAGPGEIDSTLKFTEESDFTNGVACAEYEHPDGPVPEGLTAVIDVEAQQDADIARTSIVLQPREADVRLSARVLPDGAFVPIGSNGSFPTSAGDAVEVRATLRGSGDRPADPLVAISDGELVATLDDGNGILTVDGTPAVPLGLTTGADGTATFRWEPNGDDPSVIRVAHPADGPGVAATVTVGPDPTTIDGDIVVRTDAEVAELEGVTQISGSLTIGRDLSSPATTISTVTDLSPLDSLTTIGGRLSVVENPDLVDLDGLDALETVGGRMSINGNASLVGLDALSSLTSAQALEIFALPLVTDLDGLQGLASLPGRLAIASNPALVDITALSNLQGTIGDLRIVRNPALTSVDGLQGVTTVDGSFSLEGPALTSLDGLSSLATITGAVELSNNQNAFAALATFSLPALTSIGENLDISGAGIQSVGTELVDAPNGSIALFHFPALTQIGQRFRIDNHRAGAQVQIVTSPELRVDRSMEVFGNGGGAQISVSVAEVDWGVAISSNDDARIELTIDRVIQDLNLQFNVDTDLQLDIGSVSRDVQIGGVPPQFGASRGNVRVALPGLRIEEVDRSVFVIDNVGFTDSQALSWAQGIGGGPSVNVSRNRLV